MLIESIQAIPLCFQAIPFNNPKIQFTFQAKNLDQKREWCLLLKNVILESYQAIPTHAKQIIRSLGQKSSLNSVEIKHKVSFPVHLNRKLSAPEYLEKTRENKEKRCKAQQNKLSSSASNSNLINSLGNTNCNSNPNNTNLSLGLQFSNLQKGFRLRKSLKKGVHFIGGRNNTSNLNNLNNKKSIIGFKEIEETTVVNKSTADNQSEALNLMDDKMELQLHKNELTNSYEEDSIRENRFDKEILMETDKDKLINNNNISSCLSSTSLTTTNDSGVGSTSSVCCYSQLRLTTPIISLGSSIASIESNLTTTTANSYSTGYSQLSGYSTSSKLANSLQCSSNILNQSISNQSSNDDFSELLNDHELNIKLNRSNSALKQTFKNKRCTNRCCHGDLASRYGFNNKFDFSPSTSLTRFDTNKTNYLYHSKYYNAYRHSKYLNLNSEEIELRPHNHQVRRVQSFTIGNKNLNSRLLTNYSSSSSSSSNKSFALNAGCSSSNGSALLQHTVSFRKSPNVDLVLAKLRHLHRRPSIVAAQKQLYKQQQKMQQLNELKLQELNLSSNSGQELNVDEDNIESTIKSNGESASNQTNSIFKITNDLKEDNSSSSEDECDKVGEKTKSSLIKKLIKPSKLSKDSMHSMEELSPTSPENWLKKHEKNFNKDTPSIKKNGSLPRNIERCL